MKKSNMILGCGLLISVLAGCTDATAKLSDSSSTLFTIGNAAITKGEVYSMMFNGSGASVAVNDAESYIAKQEIEITDEMKESAQGTLDMYTTYYGDSFTKYLEDMEMSEEDYLNEYLIPGLQADELPKKYVEEKFDELVETFAPYKATILSFTSEDDAKAALSELNDGTATAEEAATNHNSSSSGKSQMYTIESTDLDSMARTVLTSMTVDDGWAFISSSDGATFYVLRMDEKDPEAMHDEIKDTLANISNVQNDAKTYWFKKYNFHVYDIDLYNAIKADFPDNLVQDLQ